ncbi:MAG TPA: 4-alpha-glucanotransferase, partial [Acidimicrobiales bacterium]|nr:4-alpha-glucanotransferase [Acidimicrobiales bacterium]
MTGRGDAASTRQALEQLARRCGVAVSYVDQAGERRRCSPEALLGVLGALGEPVATLADVPAALAAREASGAPVAGGADGHGRAGNPSPGLGLPPVVIAWDGVLAALPLPERAGGAGGAASDGRRSPTTHRHPNGARVGRSEGRPRATIELDPLCAAERPAPRASVVSSAGTPAIVLDGPLPYGIHQLELDEGGGSCQVLRIVAAPRRAAAPAGYQRGGWGVFAPTYSLRDQRQRAAGDLTALRRLGETMAAQGASIVATLPLLAELATADGGLPGQAPYAPLSRMWWNEAYLDLDRLPELAGGPAPAGLDGARLAGAGLDGTGLDGAQRGRRAGAGDVETADLASIASRARPLLQEGAERLEAAGGRRRAELHRYLRQQPDVRRYASFRAAIELYGADRARWPAAWRAGRISPRGLPAAPVLRHCYAQWAMDRQLGEDAAALRQRGCGYLLDLPIGCRPDGYDP